MNTICEGTFHRPETHLLPATPPVYNTASLAAYLSPGQRSTIRCPKEGFPELSLRAGTTYLSSCPVKQSRGFEGSTSRGVGVGPFGVLYLALLRVPSKLEVDGKTCKSPSVLQESPEGCGVLGGMI